MQIYLIRHGETDWNKQMRIHGREDIELNNNGILQANKCGQVFRNLSIDLIISSPLKRAKETSKIIASYLGIEKVIIDENLIERDYGKLSGLIPQEREKNCNSGQKDEMESWDDLSKRIKNVLNNYSNNIEYKNIIMVSHGAAINAVLAILSDYAIGTGKTKLKNACINVLHCTNQSMKIDMHNLTSEEFRDILKTHELEK